MKPLLFPITQRDTVHEYIVMSMQESEKLNQRYTFITMDLAAAKLAYEVVWSDPERFGTVIVHLGAFHTTCSYLGSLSVNNSAIRHSCQQVAGNDLTVNHSVPY